MQEQVIIDLTREEHALLLKRAQEMGTGIPEYIKAVLFPEEECDPIVERLNDLLASIPTGGIFTVRELLGVEWRELPRGRRLKIGKEFMKQVRRGNVPNVRILEQSRSGQSQEYRKVGEENENN